MNTAYWCVLIAGIMPVFTVAIAKAQRGFDNANPRQWLEQQSGLRKRADYAHRNHFEAFPFFAAGVIIAHQLGAAAHLIDQLAMVFIAARIAYTIFYLTDRASLRSVAFLVAYACVIGLFMLAAFASS